MATTYTAAQAATGIPARVPSPAGLTAVKGTYALTGALVVNDVVNMVKVPEGAVIYQVILGVPDLDSNGSPAVVLAVGDTTTADRFITGSTVGQAGGVATINQAAGVGYRYAVDAGDTLIAVKVTTAPATSATAGTLTLTVIYGKE